MSGRSWYFEAEDDIDERNEEIGKAFVASLKTEPQPIVKTMAVAKLYTHENGQISLFEEVPKAQRIGSTRGIEYVLIAKQGHHIIERTYVEEYGPEIED